MNTRQIILTILCVIAVALVATMTGCASYDHSDGPDTSQKFDDKGHPNFGTGG